MASRHIPITSSGVPLTSSSSSSGGGGGFAAGSAANAVSGSKATTSSGNAMGGVPPRVCFLLTSVAKFPDGKETGFHLEELCTPYYVFQRSGFAIDMASVLGGTAPIDPASRSQPSENVEKFLLDKNAIWQLENTKRIADLQPDFYDAIFLVGGHGAAFDFTGPAVGSFVEQFFALGKTVAAICHGPAGLVAPLKPNGEPLVAGLQVTCFSDKEEKAYGTDQAVPFLLETRLRALGAIFIEPAKPMAPNVAVDYLLMTGSNPASAQPLAEAVAQRLNALAA